jgi:hypothetical protein
MPCAPDARLRDRWDARVIEVGRRRPDSCTITDEPDLNLKERKCTKAEHLRGVVLRLGPHPKAIARVAARDLPRVRRRDDRAHRSGHEPAQREERLGMRPERAGRGVRFCRRHERGQLRERAGLGVQRDEAVEEEAERVWVGAQRAHGLVLRLRAKLPVERVRAGLRRAPHPRDLVLAGRRAVLIVLVRRERGLLQPRARARPRLDADGARAGLPRRAARRRAEHGGAGARGERPVPAGVVPEALRARLLPERAVHDVRERRGDREQRRARGQRARREHAAPAVRRRAHVQIGREGEGAHERAAIVVAIFRG